MWKHELLTAKRSWIYPIATDIHSVGDGLSIILDELHYGEFGTTKMWVESKLIP